MGQYDATARFGATVGPAIPTQYYVTLNNGVDSFKTNIPFPQTLTRAAQPRQGRSRRPASSSRR